MDLEQMDSRQMELEQMVLTRVDSKLMGLRVSAQARVALCLTASAASFFLGTGLSPAWALTWLAPIPVLWLAPRVTAGQAFLAAAAAYALGALNVWYYMSLVTPVWVVMLNAVAPACVFGAAALLFRNCVLRGRLGQAVVIVPAFWVTFEYVTSLVSVHGTIGNLGYSQLLFLPVLQIASLTGIWGISFSLFLFAAAVAALLSEGPRVQKRLVAAAAAVFLICVFGYGFGRLARSTKDAPMVRVGLIASDDAEMLSASTPEETAKMYARFGEQMRGLAGQGVQLFVLPEHSGSMTDASVGAADQQLGGLAKETGAFVAVGVDRIRPTVAWNEERLYTPEGTLAASYDKHHLLPPWEDRFTQGTTRSVVRVPSGLWGLGICKDMDFTRLSRGYGQDGVGLMVVPGWDFTMDGWSHGSIAIMRGVEDGFSVIRSAKKSVLYAADDRGRVLARRGTDFVPFATMIATVPVHHDATLYSRWGDWFAWLSVALLAGLVGARLREGRRAARG